jgi:hypothetical protein
LEAVAKKPCGWAFGMSPPAAHVARARRPAEEARAIEIAAQIAEAAEAAIEVRECMDAPPDDMLEQQRS